MLSRRRFSQLVLAGAGLSSCGALALWRGSGYRVPDEVASGLAVLAPWQVVVVEAFGARVLAPERARVAPFADRYLMTIAAADRRDLLRFVAYLEHGAPFSAGLLGRFSALDGARQDAVLTATERSPFAPLRAGFAALKALAMMAYYRQPESWAALGYSGPVVYFGRSG